MGANPNLTPMSRIERAEQALALRAQGLLQREIAAELGISRSYASSLLADPEGVKDKERKDSYRKPCPQCGELMGGGEGPNSEKFPKLCYQCAPLATRYWTRERIIDAIQRWNEIYGRPPVATEWLVSKDIRGEGFPPTSAIYKYNKGARGGVPGTNHNPFDSWADAVEAAGFPRPRRGEYKVRERRAVPQATRDYLVFRVNGDSYEVVGISNQPSNDEAIADIADEEGEYASVAIPNLTRRSVRKRLSVVRSESGHLQRQEHTKVSE